VDLYKEFFQQKVHWHKIFFFQIKKKLEEFFCNQIRKIKLFCLKYESLYVTIVNKRST
jgi:hypothetical protein